MTGQITVAPIPPDKPAIISAVDGSIVTYAELEASSIALANYLNLLGVGVGDSIAIMMENQPELLEIAWGAQRSGIYYTALNTHLLVDEVAYIIKDCGAKVVFASPSKVELIDAALEGKNNVLRRVVLGEEQDGWSAFRDYSTRDLTAATPTPVEGNDMLYSSGTTGRPKGIKWPLSNDPFGGALPRLTQLMAFLYGFDESTIYLSPAPLYHAAPLRFCMSTHRLGGTVVIMDHFDPERYLEYVEKYKISHSQVVPTMFVRILKLDPETKSKYLLTSLRSIIHAAAPCPIQIKREMMDWWGPIIHEYYAGTEGNGYVACSPTDWLAHPGSVGRALLGEIHILNDEGVDAPIGSEGVIYFANGGQFEYHNDPAKTESAHNDRGWSTLGDVGHLDSDGFLYLTDRSSYMIISGGVNIYPQEAENILITHPLVADAAVIGVPNEEFGEEVKAVVELLDPSIASPQLASELIDYCRSLIAPIKCPRSIDFRLELPRAPTGKLYKRLLRDEYWRDRDSKII
ncbi:AMP-binding protein [Acidithrix ferrooxidans]|uniref:Long-chain-fatty-acid--CoA ligase FadD13 n=1 Tax=Acidithrix ferrooxidans TaxID=1280514 RepID=A0A0D8HDV6_9ACTN|nr:AMP-binding protein [Acidithrix ferrooxidans]KJF16064.1 long-chain-fatty-acid--CoA ligase FadD13 [Acidithrix ferrooxidans]